MRKSVAILTAGVLVSLVGGAANSQPSASAVVTPKVLLENSDVRVTENTFPPGAVSPQSERPHRVVYWISGSGPLKQTYADGHVLVIEGKPGEARWHEAGKLSVTNAGPDDVHVLTINVKK